MVVVGGGCGKAKAEEKEITFSDWLDFCSWEEKKHVDSLCIEGEKKKERQKTAVGLVLTAALQT